MQALLQQMHTAEALASSSQCTNWLLAQTGISDFISFQLRYRVHVRGQTCYYELGRCYVDPGWLWCL